MPDVFPPPRCRTWQYESTVGGLEKNLYLNPNRELPVPTEDQHLVQIIAVALNPVDHKPAETLGRLVIPRVATPGIDIAGVIVTPAKGSPLKQGQLIFGAASDKPFAAGGLSEFAAVPKASILPIPVGLDPIDAATLPVAGMSAYQSIARHVKKGDHVFINGGSGGVGTLGIQIAKALGCHVTTTCSGPNIELVKSLGADEVFDYTEHTNLAEALKTAVSTNKISKFDHMVDNVYSSTDLYYNCHEFSNPKAKYIFVAGHGNVKSISQMTTMKYLPTIFGGGKRFISGFYPELKPEDLQQLADWAAEGKIKAVIDHRFAFGKAVEAFERLKSSRARGKVVIEVTPQNYLGFEKV